MHNKYQKKVYNKEIHKPRSIPYGIIGQKSLAAEAIRLAAEAICLAAEAICLAAEAIHLAAEAIRV